MATAIDNIYFWKYNLKLQQGRKACSSQASEFLHCNLHYQYFNVTSVRPSQGTHMTDNLGPLFPYSL